MFRTSGDISARWDRVISNLQTTLPFLKHDDTLGSSLSRPGCWAYPDMLEVGRMSGEVGFDGATYVATPVAESRSHFGAWAISSSPLILGMDLSADNAAAQAALDAVWDVVTNKEVVAVSQVFLGVPGTLVRSWQAQNAPTLVAADCADATANVTSWAFTPDGMLRQASTGLCFDAAGVRPYYDEPNWMRVRECDASVPTQQFAFVAETGQIECAANFSSPFPRKQCLRVEDHWLWCEAACGSAANRRRAGAAKTTDRSRPTPSPRRWPTTIVSLGDCAMTPGSYFVENFTVNSANGSIVAAALNGRVHCVATSLFSGPPSQIWSKPVAGGMAVFVVNGALLEQQVTFDLAEVNITTPTASVRDLWAHADLPPSSGSITVSLEPHGSAFLLLRPASEP